MNNPSGIFLDSLFEKCMKNVSQGVGGVPEVFERFLDLGIYECTNEAIEGGLMVVNIKARNKVFEERVSRQIDEEFQRLYTALEARKSNLFAELREASDAFNVNLEKAARNLEEQKKDMKSRVLCAEKLKASPDLTIYCNLNQLIADLMADFKIDHMIESLKTHPDIRFSINVEGIINVLETIGSISYDDTANSQVMPDDSTFLPSGSEYCPLAVEPMHENGATDVTEKTCSMDFECNLVQMVKNEYDLELECQPCLETVDSGHQATSILSFKNNSLHLDSIPDVIIEQIIDEDFPNTELYSCKSKKLKKSEGKMAYSPPFSQKKGDHGNVELVCLIHIVNPCNFYIHRLSQNKQLIMLERSLSMLGRTSSHCSPCDILELGEYFSFHWDGLSRAVGFLVQSPVSVDPCWRKPIVKEEVEKFCMKNASSVITFLLRNVLALMDIWDVHLYLFIFPFHYLHFALVQTADLRMDY
ncbi:RING finger protein 17-like [Aquarana catesbeiana]|uniref:RING finger protein 17-like n=1 Tax=Aquarana catesbeiana TaxID=8400 RepID=UPI003CCA4CDD